MPYIKIGKDTGSSSLLVVLFKRDPLMCKGFSER